MRSNLILAPFHSASLDQDFSRLLDGVFGQEPNLQADWRPAADIAETETSYEITIDLPGLSKKDISINLNDNVLSVTGKRELVEKQEGTTYFRSERIRGSFERNFRLPKAVDIEGVKAKFQNGVLTIEIPKAMEAMSRMIEIS